MRGRKPSGAGYVQQLDGSAQAKERLQVILETLTGRLRVQQACALLQIGPQRFHQLREQALAAALAGLEPRPLGRPKQAAVIAPAQLEALTQQLAATEVELRAARVREEVALILPGPEPVAEDEAAVKKKSPRSRNRTRNSRRST